MRLFLVAVAVGGVLYGQEAARWEREARNVTIVRDDWGIAHIYGKTDADAVFGTLYAQAEGSDPSQPRASVGFAE